MIGPSLLRGQRMRRVRAVCATQRRLPQHLPRCLPQPPRCHATAAAASETAFLSRVRSLRQSSRAALASRGDVGGLREEVTAIQAEASETLAAKLEFEDLCSLCRVLVTSGRKLEDSLLDIAGRLLRETLKTVNDVGSLRRETADAAAVLALAVCEAGHEHGLGREFVDHLCAAGFAKSSGSGNVDSETGLRGGGAASLLLAAAASGRADTSLMDALLTTCSADEKSLTVANLGDARLAANLAGPEAVAGLDVRAAGFLRTLCGEALLDDPRGLPPLAAGGGYAEVLTDFELDVSQALHAAEVPHSKGTIISGIFVPLASLPKNYAVFPEDSAARSVYQNAPNQRTSLQRWRLRAVAAAGWKVAVVSETSWRALADAQDKADHMRQTLQEPLDVEHDL